MEIEDKSDDNNKIKIFLSIILVIILIISVVGVTYALFIYGKEGQIKNIVTTGSLTFSYVETSNGISLENAMPISDDVGKKLDNSKDNNGFFDFNVSCKIAGTDRIQYEVYATQTKVVNKIEEQYVKIYLTDGTNDTPISGYNVEVPTYNHLKDAILNKEGKQLYYGNFTSSGTQSFRLRMWLSEQYPVSSVSEQFKIKINIAAIGN